MIGSHGLHVRWIISLVASIQLWTGPSEREVLPPSVTAELQTSSIMDGDIPHDVIAEGYSAIPIEHSEVDLHLARGVVNRALEMALPATYRPVLPPAPNTALRIEMSDGDVAESSSSEAVPIVARVPIGNQSSERAGGVIAYSAHVESPTAQPATRTHLSPVDQLNLDPAVGDVWHQKGCHLNPANPSCLIGGALVECAIVSAGTACIADSDGDRCFDVAEGRVGLEAFGVTDCMSSTTGQPALNCLFLLANRACNGDRIASPEDPECAAQHITNVGRHPNRAAECGVDRELPLDDCEIRERDPACDGFAPGYEGESYG